LFIQAGFFYGMSRQKSGVGPSAKSLVPNSAFVVLKGSLMGVFIDPDRNELLHPLRVHLPEAPHGRAAQFRIPCLWDCPFRAG
jgi:hypothetical protein